MSSFAEESLSRPQESSVVEVLRSIEGDSLSSASTDRNTSVSSSSSSAVLDVAVNSGSATTDTSRLLSGSAAGSTALDLRRGVAASVASVVVDDSASGSTALGLRRGVAASVSISPSASVFVLAGALVSAFLGDVLVTTGFLLSGFLGGELVSAFLGGVFVTTGLGNNFFSGFNSGFGFGFCSADLISGSGAAAGSGSEAGAGAPERSTRVTSFDFGVHPRKDDRKIVSKITSPCVMETRPNTFFAREFFTFLYSAYSACVTNPIVLILAVFKTCITSTTLP